MINFSGKGGIQSFLIKKKLDSQSITNLIKLALVYPESINKLLVMNL